MNYEVILFDADQTLYDFLKCEREALKNVMLDYEIDYDENYHLKLYKEVNTAIWKELERGEIALKTLKIERFNRFLKKLVVDHDKYEFAAKYNEHLANGSFLYPGAEALLVNLSKKYRLAIVTNGLTLVQDKRIRQSSVAQYFDHVCISEEINISKPNPLIFDHTLEILNHIDRSKVLMVGDSLTSDIQGGINAEIDTCWYNPNHIPNKTSIQPTYEVHNYNDLLKLLDMPIYPL